VSRALDLLKSAAISYARSLAAKPVSYGPGLLEARARTLRETAEAVDVADRSLCSAAVAYAREQGVE